jgi:L-ascorbate metabolism protein UlaG (beta-lactamase superfamily)
MLRLLSALCAALLTAGLAGAAEPKKTIIRWHGQSFFEIISSTGTRIVTDPHAIENFGGALVDADLVLISHLHSDHMQTGVIRNLKDAKVIQGLKDEKGDGKKVDWNPVDEKFKDVHVRSVGVFHDGMQGMQYGKNSIFIIEVDGLRIVHLGDLGHQLTDAQIKKIGPVDVLMIPVGGVYTINGSEARKVVEKLKPAQYIIPMHYGVKVFDDLLPINEFLDEQNPDFIKRFDTNELSVTADFKTAAPIIAILHWAERVEK